MNLCLAQELVSMQYVSYLPLNICSVYSEDNLYAADTIVRLSLNKRSFY